MPAHRLGLAPRLHAFDEGAPGEDGEAERAEPDQDFEQAEPVGIIVGAGDEPLGVHHSPVEMGALGIGDVLEPAAHRGQQRRGDDPVEQGANAGAVAGLAAGDGDRPGQLLAAPLEQAPELRDPAGLGRILGDLAAELVDLEGGDAAVAIISAAGALLPSST